MICQERNAQDEVCGGSVTTESDGDWLYFRCDGCGVERARHARTASPQSRRELRLERAGLPQVFVGVRFEQTDDTRPALVRLRSWLGEYRVWRGDTEAAFPRAPALFGKPGRGKTHLLTGVCVRLINECDASVMWRSARMLLRELQDFGGEAARTWELATSCDVLALDDLGSQQVTDWRHDQLADLIDRRYELNRPVVLATNFAPSTWGEAVDERTASRLRGMTFPLELRGPDRRQISTDSLSQEAI